METQDTYHNISIYDIGVDKSANMSESYERAVGGSVLIASSVAKVAAPNLARTRIEPDLGDEIFWGNDQPTVANPPRVYVFAINRTVRQGSSYKVLQDNDDNAKSIGLIVKFNDFYYYLGGDLPKEAERLIWADISSNATQPWGKSPADHVCGFKAGHHGAKTSTDINFLKNSKAKVCLISCGKNGQFDHPTQETIDTLLDKNSLIKGFFLTGCVAGVKNVPAALGKDQFNVTNNKAWVAGMDGVADGDICLAVTAQYSQGKNHQFSVQFDDVHPTTFNITSQTLTFQNS